MRGNFKKSILIQIHFVSKSTTDRRVGNVKISAVLKIDGAHVVEIAGINDVIRIPPAIKIGCGETHR